MSTAHSFPVRIYYEDTDFSGNVYHAAYLKFFERARTEWLRALGVHHSVLALDGLAFAVRHMEIDFFKSAHIDDELVVTTELDSIGGARVVLDQAIHCGAAELTRTKVTIAVINSAGRAARLPESLRSALSGI